MIFLTQMPAMIRPKYDYGVFCVGGILQCFQDTSHLCICKSDTRQVTSNGFLPLTGVFGCLHLVTFCFGPFTGNEWNIIQVVKRGFRQMNICIDIEVMEPLGNIPGEVGMKGADGEKNGLPSSCFPRKSIA